MKEKKRNILYCFLIIIGFIIWNINHYLIWITNFILLLIFLKKIIKNKKEKKIKLKNKSISIIFLFLLFISFLSVINFNKIYETNEENNKTDLKNSSDYSYYLYNNPIDLTSDTIQIFQESATSNNQYRNYFELKEGARNPILAYSGTNDFPSTYQGNQAFLDLRDNRTFLTKYWNLTYDYKNQLNSYEILNGSLNNYNPYKQKIKIDSELINFSNIDVFNNLSVKNGKSVYNSSLNFKDNNYSIINSTNSYTTNSLYRNTWNISNNYNITGFTAFENSTGKTNFLLSIYNTSVGLPCYRAGNQIDVWYIKNNTFKFWKTLKFEYELDTYPIQDITIKDNCLYLYVNQVPFTYIEVCNMSTNPLTFIDKVYIPSIKRFNCFEWVEIKNMFYLGSYYDNYVYWITSDLSSFYGFDISYKSYNLFNIDNLMYTFDNYNITKRDINGNFISNHSYNRLYEFDNAIVVNNSVYFLENCTDYYYNEGGMNDYHAYFGYHISKFDIHHYDCSVVYNCSFLNFTFPFVYDNNYQIFFSINSNVSLNTSIYLYNYSSGKYDKKICVYNPKFEIYNINITLNSDYFLNNNIFIMFNSTNPNKFKFYIDLLTFNRTFYKNKVDIIFKNFFRPLNDLYEVINYIDIILDKIEKPNFKFKIYVYNFSLNSYQLIDYNITKFKTYYYNFTYSFKNESVIDSIHEYTFQYFKIDLYINSSEIETIIFEKHNITYSYYSNMNGWHHIGATYNIKDGASLKYTLYVYIHVYEHFIFFESLYTIGGFEEIPIATIPFFYNGSYLPEINFLEFTILLRYGHGITTDNNRFVLDVNLVVNYNLSIYFHQEREFDFSPYDEIELNQFAYSNWLNNYSCLVGTRNVFGNLAQFNSFLYLPYFNDDIGLTDYYDNIPNIYVDMEVEEPDLPTPTYWTFISYRLALLDTTYFNVGNWSNLEFNRIVPETYTAKYPYSERVLKNSDFGVWVFYVGDFKVSFNFLRNAVCWLINMILLLIQYFLYLIVAGLSFIFMFLGTWIITFLYNIVFYYIYYGIIWIIWLLYVAIFWIWKGLLWLWSNVIYPFLVWCYEVLLPLIMDGIIMIIAFLITCFIYVLTLGQVSFWDTYEMVYDILWLLVDFVLEWINLFAHNMEAIFLFMIWYLLNAGLIYFRYLYSRSRGNINRAEQLYYTFQIYIAPMVFVYNLLKKLLDSSPVA